MGHAAGCKHQRRVRVDSIILSHCNSLLYYQVPATSAQAKAAKAQHAASQPENMPPQSTSGHDDKEIPLPQAGESEAEPKGAIAGTLYAMHNCASGNLHPALCIGVSINPVLCR